MTTTNRTSVVIVSRCNKCGLEHTQFRVVRGPCVRCGNRYLQSRAITNPGAETFAQAARETEAAERA